MKIFLLALLLAVTISSIESLIWVGDFANFASWPIGNPYLTENREIVNDPKGSGQKVLKVKYPAGSYSSLPGNKGGTGFFVWPFGTNIIQHATLEFEVLFPADWDWVKGGKLPGLFGGRTSCSGGDMALDCFSTRFMFGPNGGGYAYLYVSKVANHSAEFCALTTAPNCSPDWGYGIGGSKYFDKDRWIKIKQLVKLNTPGRQDGRLTIWVDNVQKFDFAKMVYRTGTVPISGIAFETFFGGNTADWATPKTVYSYFRNFRIETF
ncbi:unnamed protein product [Brachionus calyciflorus]|uniref:Polysaccharide lyase 14 domain-containing protein n=1 Tax=Brachionus calyciflorus TaxID=104777 RepID=A0A814FDR2_9BILA|nr:unnamed protein product [Brachionus calyciflorus]